MVQISPCESFLKHALMCSIMPNYTSHGKLEHNYYYKEGMIPCHDVWMAGVHTSVHDLPLIVFVVVLSLCHLFCIFPVLI